MDDGEGGLTAAGEMAVEAMVVEQMVEGEMVTMEKERRGKVLKGFSLWAAVHFAAHPLVRLPTRRASEQFGRGSGRPNPVSATSGAAGRRGNL